MSKHLYTFLPADGVSSVARAIHLPLANWGFVLMSLHAGTHLDTMLPKEKKAIILDILVVLMHTVAVVHLYESESIF